MNQYVDLLHNCAFYSLMSLSNDNTSPVHSQYEYHRVSRSIPVYHFITIANQTIEIVTAIMISVIIFFPVFNFSSNFQYTPQSDQYIYGRKCHMTAKSFPP